MTKILTIAGSDPSGGAGLQADLRVFWDLDVAGMSVVTAVTSQNEKRFYSLNPVPSTLLREQLRSVTSMGKIDAVKIGLLGTPDVAMAVCRFLDDEEIPIVVLDTVMKSSTGSILLEPKGIGVLQEFLIPRATIITPNLAEASILAKMKVNNLETMLEAARKIYDRNKGVGAVLIKGGHLEEKATDILFDGEEMVVYDSVDHFNHDVHGTGCVLSSALTVFLAKGDPLRKAVKRAKDYVIQYIKDHQPGSR